MEQCSSKMMQSPTASNQDTDADTDSTHDCSVVVVDNGSATLRAGLGSSDRPSLIMPSIIGRPRLADLGVTATMPGKSGSSSAGGDKDDQVFFGNDVLTKPGGTVLQRRYPVCWGLVQNWDDLSKMWHYVFEQKIGVQMEESPLLVMESAYMVPKINREKMTELAFETFYVPAFYLAHAPAAVLLSMERTTGLVIDIGRNNVRVVPVYEGHHLPHAVMKFELGSQNVTEYLNSLLSRRGVSLAPFSEEPRRMKDQLAYVAQNYEKEKETFSEFQERTYTLPANRDVITLWQERFQCAETLFQPSLLGMEMPGLVEHVVMTISKCLPDIRQTLLSSVVLVGGGSMLPGLATRLQRDVEEKLRCQPELRGLHVQVLAPPAVPGDGEGDLMVWRGGSCLACLPQFAQMCITKEEYDEYGPSMVHRKC